MRTKKPATHYLATDADGIIPASLAAGTPVNLADAVGTTIDHPNPCQNLWYDETAFSYFRTVTAPGEVLADVPGWPRRLWIIEPLGTTGTWGGRDSAHRLFAHRIRVVQETESWQALGSRGRQVLDLIDHQLPDLARTWAATHTADPDRVHQAYEDWRLCNSREPEAASGMNAKQMALSVAGSSRCSAALWTVSRLAIDAAHTAADEFGRSAAHYAAMRAEALAFAVLLENRLRDYTLTALRGAALDQALTAAA
ncbi:hypothetical protein ACIOJE_27195 [Kitasatospora sp. NPDC087861]|uniref:hypothetical protein n=1 Tax=Kitasatospora sp. NPDC087861 TaxID=3364070 RepID=UPI00381CDBC9